MTRCDDTPERYNHRCGTGCGGDPERQAVFRYCTGDSAGCTDHNLMEAAWETTAGCGADTVCRVDADGAYCHECDLGCEDGHCLGPECESGPCCIDEHFAPPTLRCDDTVLDTEYGCSSDACGASTQKREQKRYCTGGAAECTDDNLVWEEWSSLTTCDGGQICQKDGSNAWCAACELGCADGRCRECESGPCCDNGFYAEDTVQCDLTESESCENNQCGGDVMVESMRRYCSGFNAICNGDTEWLERK